MSRINLRRTIAPYTVRDGGGDEHPLCAVVGCSAAGRRHECPADGELHSHGRIHYKHCHADLAYNEGWHLICDEHYAVCVQARRAVEVRP